MRKVIAVTLILCLFFNPLANATWLSGWNYRRKITIDHSLIDSGLTNFPVMVKLVEGTNFEHADAKDAGEDIRFTQSDGDQIGWRFAIISNNEYYFSLMHDVHAPGVSATVSSQAADADTET